MWEWWEVGGGGAGVDTDSGLKGRYCWYLWANSRDVRYPRVSADIDHSILFFGSSFSLVLDCCGIFCEVGAIRTELGFPASPT